MNRDAKILNKMSANVIQWHIKRVIYHEPIAPVSGGKNGSSLENLMI